MGVEGLSVEMMTFNEMVSMLVEAMDTQAGKIEEEKLKVGCGWLTEQAVGARNRVDGESEARRRKEKELSMLISEKKMELER